MITVTPYGFIRCYTETRSEQRHSHNGNNMAGRQIGSKQLKFQGGWSRSGASGP